MKGGRFFLTMIDTENISLILSHFQARHDILHKQLQKKIKKSASKITFQIQFLRLFDLNKLHA
jgi:hypothetical protein